MKAIKKSLIVLSFLSLGLTNCYAYSAGGGTVISDNNNTQDIAIGIGSLVKGDSNSIAIGEGATVRAATGIAIGGAYANDGPKLKNICNNYEYQGTYVTGDRSTAIGTAIYLEGAETVVIGSRNTTIKSTGLAGTIIKAKYGTALGNETNVGNNSTALGYSATAMGTNSIALGANTTVKDSNVVGIGNRRMTQMAAGTADTDGVNVKQLNAVKNSIKVYTGSSDIAISSANAISVNKNGAIENGNTGIVTGGTVYSVTNKLSSTLDTQKSQLTAATKRLSTLNSTISDLKDSIIDINTSVTSAILSSSATINGRLDTSLSNLSEDGKDSLRQFIRSEMKNISTTNMAKSNVSTLAMPAVFDESNDVSSPKLDELSKTVESKADISYVNQELDKKADKAELEKVSTAVKNNAEKIGQNAKDIQNLKESKADVDASNINVSKFTEKLGIGQVEKDNTGLVTGGTVANALEKKADLDYVNDGFNRMEGEMQQMNRSLSRDIARVGAGAAALAGLHPQEYDPNNKLDFATGYGHYKNANATAIGMYYRPNAGTTISLASTLGNGDPMISAGLSFKIGYGKNVEKVIITKDAYDKQQQDNAEMRQEINDLKQALAQVLASKSA